jgi:hypothetical protein
MARSVTVARPPRAGAGGGIQCDARTAGASRDSLGAEKQQHRLAPLDHARQPQPGRVRKLPDGTRGDIREIERDHAEAAGLHDEVQGL